MILLCSRGIVFGIWSANASLGNIIGALQVSVWVLIGSLTSFFIILNIYGCSGFGF